MANTGFKGAHIRQTGNQLLFDVFLQAVDGTLLGSGTTTVSLIEVQSDGTIKSYDFNDNTFKTTALTTPTLALTHRPSNNGGTTTGYWTVALATLTGFTIGATYRAIFNNVAVNPNDQMYFFQYGSAEGDLVVTANGTGVGEINADVIFSNGVSAIVYFADIVLTRNTGSPVDEYTVTWFKDGVRVTSGITSPTIQVVKRSDGSDLVASTAMTQVASTGTYKYDEASNTITAGAAYLVIASASINSGTRSWSKVIGRDV